MYNNPYNPYLNNSLYSSQNPMQYPHYEVIQVNGKPGVDEFKMAPNSSTILVDQTKNLVWFVSTDGAGYKSATPFVITPYVEEPPVDVNVLSKRLDKIEEMLLSMQNGGQNNDESNINVDTTRKQQKQPRNQQPAK